METRRYPGVFVGTFAPPRHPCYERRTSPRCFPLPFFLPLTQQSIKERYYGIHWSDRGKGGRLCTPTEVRPLPFFLASNRLVRLVRLDRLAPSPGRRQKKRAASRCGIRSSYRFGMPLGQGLGVCDREGLLLLAGGLSVLHLLAELGEGVEVSEGRLLCGGRGGGALIDLHV